MRVKVLGAAAGGGFPQWNCRCLNCRRLRQGALRGVARTQAQLALSAGEGWCLVNASPDLRVQIESAAELQPREGLRHSPISSVVLTCAELDQVLGLLLLRESQTLRVYATGAVRRILLEDNSMFGMLQRYPGQVTWCDIEPDAPFSPLRGIRCLPVAVPGGYPLYVSGARRKPLPAREAVLALYLESTASGRRLAYFPGAPSVDPAWLPGLEQSEVLLFDGTFWSDDELRRVQGGGRTAREMGHLPIGGAGGTLESLAGLPHTRKLFIHVNNTNPILDEDSPEYAAVRHAGWEVARDGMEFEL
jgi:pyrroloquinoline quinone biosynthesis protein B